jgi:hypothetical protein
VLRAAVGYYKLDYALVILRAARGVIQASFSFKYNG